MEFKEKLQILRTQMRISQEELAEKLNISRQSVTKWENGQSFPDIQNLIQLSDIFKVSIDRLVKDNDTCNLNIFSQQQFANQDMRMFLVRAKNSTYITGSNMCFPSKPNSKEYRYSEGDYTYTDSYMGDEHFVGEETVWIKELPVYAMNYYGQILSENFNIDFLKEMLSLVSCERPFRGPEYHQKGDYAYHCRVHGDFNCFHGEEIIYCKHEKVYFCLFHGGDLS